MILEILLQFDAVNDVVKDIAKLRDDKNHTRNLMLLCLLCS